MAFTNRSITAKIACGSLSHQPHDGIPVRNILRMLEAARKYGAYHR